MVTNSFARYFVTLILAILFQCDTPIEAQTENRNCRFTVSYAPMHWEYFAPISKKQLLEGGSFKVCSAAIELLFNRSFDEDNGPFEIGNDLRIAIVDEQTKRELFYDGDFLFYRGRKGRVSTALTDKVIGDIDKAHSRWLKTLPKPPAPHYKED